MRFKYGVCPMFRQNRGAAERQATATMGRGGGGRGRDLLWRPLLQTERLTKNETPNITATIHFHLSECSIFGTVCIMLEKWLSCTTVGKYSRDRNYLRLWSYVAQHVMCGTVQGSMQT
jgi:hypothetical protein